METKHIATIIAMALCFGVYFYFSHNMQNRQRERMYEAEGYVPWDEEEAREVFKQSDELLASAVQELQDHRREEARLLYRKAMTNVALYLQNHGDKNLEPDLTLSEWKKLRNGVYLGSLNEEFDYLSSLLSEGNVKVEEVERFVRGYSDTDFRPLEQAFEQSKPQLENIRAQQAPKWLRLYVQDSSGGQRHEKAIESEVAKKWTPNSGFKLVFGKSLGKVETKATWKTLTIHANEESAYYEFQNQGGQFTNRSPPVIPHKLTLSFKIEGNSENPTAWDDLPEIILEAPAPETLYVEKNSSGSWDEGDRLEAENRKILLEKIEQELGKLPSFQLFPGLDADRLSIIGSDGKVDRQATTALAYLNPEKFSAQLKEALQTDSRTAQGELMGVIVNLGLEEQSGWLTQSLETAGLYGQQQVLEALKSKPWFGNWEPALYLLRKGNEDIRSKLSRELGAHMTNPRVKGAFIEIGNDPRDPLRREMARFLLQKLPQEELEPYAVWIDDRDTRFSEEIFIQLRRGDSELGRKIVLDKFSTASPRLQEIMLNGYKFNHESVDPEEISILKSAVRQKASSQLHSNALNVLLNSSYRTEVWQCLWELSDGNQLSARENDQVESKLLQNVSRAFPEKALEYYKDSIYRVENLSDAPDRAARSRQGMAITSMLGMDGLKDDSVRWLADFMAANPGNGELPLLVVRAVQQFHRIRDGWNWEQPEMIAILETGMAHNDPSARGFSYKVAGHALKKGHNLYREMLVKAADSESDEKLGKQIESLLK